MPTVSVIIPTHNRAAMLREAIDSVLVQTYQDWELLIVDDGSTDETAKVVAAYRQCCSAIQYVVQPPQGQFAALNTGLAAANGTYVAFLDDDDWWLPKKLAVQLEMLERDPALGFVYCVMCVQGSGAVPGTLKPAQHWPDTYEALLAHSFIPMTALVRRSCVTEAQGFDPVLELAGDYDFWLRIGCRHAFASTPEPLAIVRRHGTNKSANRGPRLYQAHIRIFEKLLANPALRLPYRALAIRRLAKEWYLLGRAYWLLRQPSEAATAFAQSLRLDRNVGGAFIEPTDGWAMRLWKMLKPYAATGRAGLASVGLR